MPIYEFYCEDCHTIFNFFSRRINTETRPDCPGCGRAGLERQVSLFSVSKGRKETDDDDMPGGLDDSRMEQAMMSMAGEFENLDEDDPKQAAGAMRRLYEATGLRMTSSMEEAMRRLESGEDPDRIEEDMGDFLEQENPFLAKPKGHWRDLRKKHLPPKVDETLYDL